METEAEPEVPLEAQETEQDLPADESEDEDDQPDEAEAEEDQPDEAGEKKE